LFVLRSHSKLSLGPRNHLQNIIKAILLELPDLYSSMLLR
jgi:hypothetical protein